MSNDTDSPKLPFRMPFLDLSNRDFYDGYCKLACEFYPYRNMFWYEYEPSPCDNCNDLIYAYRYQEGEDDYYYDDDDFFYDYDDDNDEDDDDYYRY